MSEDSQELFFIDTKGVDDEGKIEKSSGNAAWVDEDDESMEVNVVKTGRLKKLRKEIGEEILKGTEYSNRLKSLNNKMFKTPKWASEARKTVENESSFDFSELGENSSSSYKVEAADLAFKRGESSKTLLPDFIAIQKIISVRPPESSKGLNCVEFHPRSNVFLTSGMDKNLHIYSVDGTTSERLHSAKYRDLPISRSHFSADGSEIISVGRRPFFYSFDLATEKITRIDGVKGRDEKEWTNFCNSPCGKFMFFCGKDGNVVVLSAKSKQWLCNLKMNEAVTAVCASSDSKFLFSVGKSNTIYVWSLTTFKCVKKFTDDGGTMGTSISVSSDSSLLACGSNSGIVNVYDVNSIFNSETIKPIKSYDNIITPISGTDFHPSSQILTFYSQDKRNAMRFTHFPTGRVYSNWPTQKTPLGHISSASFNSTGDLMAAGGQDDIVHIFSLKHFSNCFKKNNN